MVTKSGSEFDVTNASTTFQGQPALVAISNSRYFAVWKDQFQNIVGEILSPTGSAVSSPFTISTTGSGNDGGQPSVTEIATDKILVAWNDSAIETSVSANMGLTGVAGRIVDVATSQPVLEGASAFQVNGTVNEAQDFPSVSALSGGGFVAAYRSSYNSGNNSSVITRTFDSSGGGGNELTIALGQISKPRVSGLVGGGFVVAYEDSSEAYVRVSDPTGQNAGAAILLDSASGTADSQPDVTTLANGNFVVSWSDSIASQGSYIEGKIFTSAGTLVNSFFVDKPFGGDSNQQQGQSRISPTSDGGFIITYTDNRGTGTQDMDGGVKAAVFDANGVAVGTPILVNSSTLGSQSQPYVAVNGSFAGVLFADGNNGNGGSTQDLGEVRGQILKLTSAPALTSATVIGSGATLTFDVQLDATQNDYPTTSQFLVEVAGSADNVTSLSISGQTASLTLASAVTSGQAVSISYTDATAGNDANAVQDTSGHDAASFSIVASNQTAPPGNNGGGGAGGSTVATVSTSASDGPDALSGTSGDDTLSGMNGADTINGGDGNDQIYGNQDSDLIDGGSGNNSVYGGMGDDQISAGAGNDLIYGNQGADTINAGDGNNTVVGGQDSTDGADYITTGSGNDLIISNGGNDTISAGGGNDTVAGGFGDDKLLGNQGNDFIYGNKGDDLISGGMGDDTLIGGQGDDTLYGNEGDDLIYGNEGADRLVFGTNSGVDIVQDFSSNEGDRLDLQGQSYVLSQNTQGSAVLTLSGGGTITLAGIEASQVNLGFFA